MRLLILKIFWKIQCLNFHIYIVSVISIFAKHCASLRSFYVHTARFTKWLIGVQRSESEYMSDQCLALLCTQPISRTALVDDNDQGEGEGNVNFHRYYGPRAGGTVLNFGKHTKDGRYNISRGYYVVSSALVYKKLSIIVRSEFCSLCFRSLLRRIRELCSNGLWWFPGT